MNDIRGDSSVPPAVGTSLSWVRDGQRRLEETVAGLPADAVREPSALAGWTRGHVLTHLARNADALVNLLTWARTGRRTPMYSSPGQRNADIEAGAGRALAEQQDDLRTSARRFAEAAAAMSQDDWQALVTNAQGRDIPAAEVPWMRVREVWIHLVDLRVGAGMDVLPAELAWTLVREVAGSMSAKVDVSVELVAHGYGRVVLGPARPRGTAAGPPAALAAWLTGRDGVGSLDRSGELPEIPRWL
ncbi:maleylpyruvate isomerase family mycothiol-dependent enzyme [Qaidamihabitans albus]|uniref:maleylpyruvate isomerase family mycothiol-dependent enzyme n=1 Tax=Qaidamihabitans albus TaxID=2795733 RepID=UPI0018F222D3|nr:maleylpyruvate isomerase family mycothiol-dependent enzyme [Qaidamihabitans albus]